VETKPDIDFSSVLASSVHDMKNSLCLLIQSIDRLSEQAQEQETSSELAKLHYEASRLNTNLLQLLSLYRAEKSSLPVNIEEHHILDIVEEIMTKNQLYLENNQINVDLDIDESLSWYIDIDLISNLLNDIFINAMRYTDSRIKISAKVLENQLMICIEDNGPGYSQHMLEQTSMTMQDLNLTNGRTGLGLFFAKLIAKAHQNEDQSGKIELKNGGELGGSQFILTLP